MTRYGVKWNWGLLKAWRCWDLTEEVTVKEALVNLKEMDDHVADHAMITQLPCTGHMTDHALIT